MTKHEKALVGTTVGTQPRTAYQRQLSDVLTIAFGRMNRVLSDSGVSSDVELLAEIQSCPFLLDYLLAECFHKKVKKTLGWEDAETLKTQTIGLYGIKEPVFGPLCDLPVTEPIVYVGGFQAWAEYHDKRCATSHKQTVIVRLEVLKADRDYELPHEAAGEYFSYRPRSGSVGRLPVDPNPYPGGGGGHAPLNGDIRPLMRLRHLIWLVLNRLPRDSNRRYFFYFHPFCIWGYCKWQEEKWHFYDSCETDPKGERLKGDDGLLLCEGMYRQ